MNSRQALKQALKGANRHAVAKAMEMQIGSLNNQVAGELPYYPKGKTLNFVDRMMNFLESVEAENGTLTLLEWMAEEFSCILIRNPAVSVSNSLAISKISEILQDFAAVIDETGKAAADQRIEPHEAENIRAKWEIMKRTTEEFVLGCETGVYNQKK
jgi:hypothetical protein